MIKQIYRSVLMASVFFLLLGPGALLAQNRVVTGKITDGSKQALPGVNVVIKGTTSGTTTNGDGEFSIEAENNATLVFSFIGYSTQEIVVGAQTKFDIVLVEDVATLNEVVVSVGYGEMKRTDLSSSQVSISADQISKTVNTTIDQALQGRAANVYVTQNTGQPGGGVSVNIRGISSLTGSNEPLYVIDGVQIPGGAGNGYGFSSSANPLASLNASDIESMEVLQGPSATSIYGSRASNGVVVITTKRGKSGNAQITYNVNYSLQDAPKTLPTMNLQEYAEYSNASLAANGQKPRTEYMDPSILGKGTDWQKALFRRVPMSKQQISISGGNDKTTYYLSGENFKQEGVAIGSAFGRSGVRLNLENKTREWLKISTNMQISQTKDKLTSTNDQLIITAIEQDPGIPVKNPDGTWGGPTNVEYQFAVTSPNPIALATINKRQLRRTTLLGGGTVDITPIKGLLIRNTINTNFQFSKGDQWEPSYQWGNLYKTTRTASKDYGGSVSWNLNQLIQYNKKIANHDITLMVSHEAQENKWEGFNGSLQGMVTNNLAEFGGGGSLGDPKTAKVGSYKGSWSMESYFGRLGYVFKDKYILQATYRADGSAKFGPRRRWGYFPSASVAWRISEEAFMTSVPQINNLKLRLEAGTTGNQNAGSYYGSLSSVSTWVGPGFLQGNYSNPSLQWERTKNYNIGLDLGMFKNRIEFIGDVYLRNVDNLLMFQPLPDYMGTNGDGAIGKPPVNIGSMRNKGFGLTLNTVNIEGPITWRTSINYSVFRNKLQQLYSETAHLDRTQWFMPGFIQRSAPGEQVWQFYVYDKVGIFQNQNELMDASTAIPNGNVKNVNSTWVGDIKYKDQPTVDTNGDGKPDAGDGVIDDRDQVYRGSPWPKFTFGFTNSVSYKNWDLSVLVTGSYGNKIFNYVRFRYENPNGAGIQRNLLKKAYDFSRIGTDTDGNAYVINAGTDVPRIGGNNGNGNRATSNYIEDGSYARVKNVQLSYSLPRSILSKTKVINKARLSFGAQNLFTFTNYKGYDPEVGAYVGNNSDTSQPAIGVDYGRYPLTRMYNFSLEVQF